MNRSTKLVALLILVMTFEIPATNLLTGDIPPLAIKNGHLDGICIDLTKEIFARTEIPLTVTFLPWARAIKRLNTEKNLLICPLTRNERRETLYQWILPVFNYKLVAITNNPNIPVNEPVMKTLAGCALRESPAGKKLKSMNLKKSFLLGKEDQCFKMLHSGRVDLVVAHGISTALYSYKINNFDANEIITLIEFELKSIYLAGSKDSFSSKYVEKLTESMDSMRTDGTYSEILKKYNLQQID